AVNTFGNDKRRPRPLPETSKTFIEVRHVIVPEPDYLSTAQTASIINACVRVAINEHNITSPRQARDCGEVCLITGCKDNARLTVVKICKLALKRTMSAIAPIGHA